MGPDNPSRLRGSNPASGYVASKIRTYKLSTEADRDVQRGQYREYRGYGAPGNESRAPIASTSAAPAPSIADFGVDGDTYINVTEGAEQLYGRVRGSWVLWPGPTKSVKTSVAHPTREGYFLAAGKNALGWADWARIKRISMSGLSSSMLITTELDSRDEKNNVDRELKARRRKRKRSVETETETQPVILERARRPYLTGRGDKFGTESPRLPVKKLKISIDAIAVDEVIEVSSDSEMEDIQLVGPSTVLPRVSQGDKTSSTAAAGPNTKPMPKYSARKSVSCPKPTRPSNAVFGFAKDSKQSGSVNRVSSPVSSAVTAQPVKDQGEARKEQAASTSTSGLPSSSEIPQTTTTAVPSPTPPSPRPRGTAAVNPNLRTTAPLLLDPTLQQRALAAISHKSLWPPDGKVPASFTPQIHPPAKPISLAPMQESSRVGGDPFVSKHETPSQSAPVVTPPSPTWISEPPSDLRIDTEEPSASPASTQASGHAAFPALRDNSLLHVEGITTSLRLREAQAEIEVLRNGQLLGKSALENAETMIESLRAQSSIDKATLKEASQHQSQGEELLTKNAALEHELRRMRGQLQVTMEDRDQVYVALQETSTLHSAAEESRTKLTLELNDVRNRLLKKQTALDGARAALSQSQVVAKQENSDLQGQIRDHTRALRDAEEAITKLSSVNECAQQALAETKSELAQTTAASTRELELESRIRSQVSELQAAKKINTQLQEQVVGLENAKQEQAQRYDQVRANVTQLWMSYKSAYKPELPDAAAEKSAVSQERHQLALKDIEENLKELYQIRTQEQALKDAEDKDAQLQVRIPGFPVIIEDLQAERLKDKLALENAGREIVELRRTQQVDLDEAEARYQRLHKETVLLKLKLEDTESTLKAQIRMQEQALTDAEDKYAQLEMRISGLQAAHAESEEQCQVLLKEMSDNDAKLLTQRMIDRLALDNAAKEIVVLRDMRRLALEAAQAQETREEQVQESQGPSSGTDRRSDSSDPAALLVSSELVKQPHTPATEDQRAQQENIPMNDRLAGTARVSMDVEVDHAEPCVSTSLPENTTEELASKEVATALTAGGDTEMDTEKTARARTPAMPSQAIGQSADLEMDTSADCRNSPVAGEGLNAGLEAPNVAPANDGEASLVSQVIPIPSILEDEDHEDELQLNPQPCRQLPPTAIEPGLDEPVPLENDAAVMAVDAEPVASGSGIPLASGKKRLRNNAGSSDTHHQSDDIIIEAGPVELSPVLAERTHTLTSDSTGSFSLRLDPTPLPPQDADMDVQMEAPTTLDSGDKALEDGQGVKCVHATRSPRAASATQTATSTSAISSQGALAFPSAPAPTPSTTSTTTSYATTLRLPDTGAAAAPTVSMVLAENATAAVPIVSLPHEKLEGSNANIPSETTMIPVVTACRLDWNRLKIPFRIWCRFCDAEGGNGRAKKAAGRSFEITVEREELRCHLRKAHPQRFAEIRPQEKDTMTLVTVKPELTDECLPLLDENKLDAAYHQLCSFCILEKKSHSRFGIWETPEILEGHLKVTHMEMHVLLCRMDDKSVMEMLESIESTMTSVAV